MLKRLVKSLKHKVKERQRPTDPHFIDVRRLIEELSHDELMQSADAYFARMTLASEQCRKPFSNAGDAVHLTRHLALVLQAADLHRGARVLDFGCATGWLTMGLAQMGCNAVGVDISPKALKLAEGLKATRAPAHGGGTLDFHAYDGARLPVDDESVDRIVCFDAFHHVRDQRATIHEFARVLKKGGRAAFMEPGPYHSRTPQSQAEMARFKVIENDVRMEDITAHALEAGLDKPQMLVQFAQPFTVDVDDFNRWARGGIARDWVARATEALNEQLTNGQCFYLAKGDPALAERDSRRADGLAAEIEVRRARRLPRGAGYGVELEVVLRNTGTRHWLTGAGSAGRVNLGVHVLSLDGRVLNNNFARLRLPREPVAPGSEVTVQGVVPMPEQAEFQLRLDLVAELVAWFGNVGRTKPALVASKDL